MMFVDKLAQIVDFLFIRSKGWKDVFILVHFGVIQEPFWGVISWRDYQVILELFNGCFLHPLPL